LKGHDFSRAATALPKKLFLKGHDFSRAATAAKDNAGFSP